MNQLDRENNLILALVQAMIGAISPNFRRVSVGPQNGGVGLQFVLALESKEDLEEISDIEFEFESLLDSATDVAVQVLVTTQDLSKFPPAGRVVFARREM